MATTAFRSHPRPITACTARTIARVAVSTAIVLCLATMFILLLGAGGCAPVASKGSASMAEALGTNSGMNQYRFSAESFTANTTADASYLRADAMGTEAMSGSPQGALTVGRTGVNLFQAQDTKFELFKVEFDSENAVAAMQSDGNEVVESPIKSLEIQGFSGIGTDLVEAQLGNIEARMGALETAIHEVIEGYKAQLEVWTEAIEAIKAVASQGLSEVPDILHGPTPTP